MLLPACVACLGWRCDAARVSAAARRRSAPPPHAALRLACLHRIVAAAAEDEGLGQQGGAHFASLVRSQAVAVEAGAAATEAVELHDYWKRRGVRLEGQRRALVQRGAAGGLFGDTKALSRRLQLLSELLPGGDAAELAWREPDVLLLSRAELASRLAALRSALPLPALDVLDLVTRAPALLLPPRPGDAAAAGLARLRALFPRADVEAMLRAQPGILLLDLAAGAATLRAAARRGAASEEEACAAVCELVSTTAGLHELLAAHHAAEESVKRGQRTQR